MFQNKNIHIWVHYTKQVFVYKIHINTSIEAAILREFQNLIHNFISMRALDSIMINNMKINIYRIVLETAFRGFSNFSFRGILHMIFQHC